MPARPKVNEGDLTDKQWSFVRNFVVTRSVTEAAKAAGYSDKSINSIGSQVIALPKVREAIDKLTKATEVKSGVTPEYVVRKLQEVVERCMQDKPVLDKEGNPTGEYRFDSAGANKALELLGKHLRMFADRLEIDVSDQLADRLAAARARLAAREVEATVIPSHSDPVPEAIDVSPCAARVESTHKKHYHTLGDASTDGSKGCDDAKGTASEPATPADGGQS